MIFVKNLFFYANFFEKTPFFCLNCYLRANVLPIIYVVDDYGAHFAAVFKVGGGEDRTLLAEKLGSLHILDLATEDHVVVRADDEFAVADIEAAVAPDDDLRLALALGHVAQSVEGDLLRHLHAERKGVLGFFLFEHIE